MTIEEREIQERIQGMTTKQKEMAIEHFPDSILWNEVWKRYAKARSKVEVFKNVANIE